MIALKFGKEWGWSLKLRRGSQGCGLWQGIQKGWKSFSKFLYFDIGLGSRIRFWHDYWCGDQSLKGTFLNLFEIATYKEQFVADMVVSHTLEEGWNWDIQFQRGFN